VRVQKKKKKLREDRKAGHGKYPGVRLKAPPKLGKRSNFGKKGPTPVKNGDIL